MRTKEFGPMLKTFANSLVALSFLTNAACFYFYFKVTGPRL